MNKYPIERAKENIKCHKCKKEIKKGNYKIRFGLEYCLDCGTELLMEYKEETQEIISRLDKSLEKIKNVR